MSTPDPATPPTRRTLFRRKPKPAKAGPGRLAQIRQVFTGAREVDPAIGWWMLAGFALTLAIVVAIGAYFGSPVYAGFIGLPLALLVAVLILSRRAERAAYRRVEGRPGAAGAVMTTLKRGWYVEQQPVAADAARPGDVASAAVVYRAMSRGGIFLVAEGPSARAQRLLVAERKKVERIVPGVPVTLMRIGSSGAEGEVPIRELSKRMRKVKHTLTAAEVSVVNKRLRALGGLKTPIPPGVDPTKVRVDRKAMRGR